MISGKVSAMWGLKTGAASPWMWLLISGIVIRGIFPLADPPANLSWSGGYYADEGFWTHDARNMTLFGAFAPDDWHDRFVSPLIYPVTAGLFRIMGPGLPAVRTWAMIASFTTLLLLAVILIRESYGLFAFLFLNIGAAFAFFQRIAILESAAIAGSTITFLIFVLARRGHARYPYLLLGVATAATYLLKGTQIYMFPAVLTALILTAGRGEKRKAIAEIGFWAAGIFLVAIPYLLLDYFPHHAALAQYSRYYAAQQQGSALDLVRNLVMQPVFVYLNRFPVLFPAAWLAVAVFPLSGDRSPVPAFAYSWMLWGILMLSPMHYRPFRYYAPLLVPVIIMGTWMWNRLRDRPPERSNSMTMLTVLSMWLLIPGLINGILLLEGLFFGGRMLGYANLPGFSRLGAGIIVIVSGILMLFFRRHRPFPRKVLSGVLAGAILVQLFWVVSWHAHREYAVLEATRELDRILPGDAVVAGQWAPELCLGTRLRAVPLWKGFVNDRDPFDRYGITHVLSWEYPLGNELDLQRKWFPAVMKNASRIHTFRIKDTPVSLWAIPPGPPTSGRETGMP